MTDTNPIVMKDVRDACYKSAHWVRSNVAHLRIADVCAACGLDDAFAQAVAIGAASATGWKPVPGTQLAVFEMGRTQFEKIRAPGWKSTKSVVHNAARDARRATKLAEKKEKTFTFTELGQQTKIEPSRRKYDNSTRVEARGRAQRNRELAVELDAKRNVLDPA